MIHPMSLGANDYLTSAPRLTVQALVVDPRLHPFRNGSFKGVQRSRFCGNVSRNLDRARPEPGEIGPSLAKIRPIVAQIGRHLPKFGPSRPNFGELLSGRGHIMAI